MTHSQALAYLIAALAFAVPTQQATKYLLQFFKGILPTPAAEPAHSNVTRLYALVIGALVLPGLAAAWAYLGYGPLYDIHELPFDVAAGAAAGFAAIGDYHLMDALQAAASGVVTLQGLSPVPPTADVVGGTDSVAPTPPAADPAPAA